MRFVHIDCGYEPGVTPLVQEGDCPNRETHTPCPSGYIQRQDWARLMARTHSQVRCPSCGLWAIWLPKAEARPINAAARREERAIARAVAKMYGRRMPE